ncbi:putative damage-inducible protein DinB [Virgibacillus halotolerans]|uniref:DinB family protein n=1 Tax=Virgibacillus halotolerans TaxID=1071053 RepID=UPI001960C780|nr:DinB family protein [Virgibacillus halotolerans]MBM7600255.1 putative damage-inducible protein DinB [Virgibacillus halotolerans]
MEINEQARTELLNHVEGLSDEDLNKKPSADRWSVKQIMEHLYLMEGAITKTIKDQLISGEIEHVENKPIEHSINRDVKVEAPGFAVPGDDFLKSDDLKQRLAGTHEGLKELEKEADEEQLKAKAYPHPAFGKVSLKQWIPFVGYHELRHIEQIKEVKQELGL